MADKNDTSKDFGPSSSSHMSHRNKTSINFATLEDRTRSRSWVQHPSPSAYSQRRRPPTPPNMIRENGTPRPIVARFGDSLYHDNIIGDTCKEITIPRVLSQGKTPQNTNLRSDEISTSGSSSSSKVQDVTVGSQPRSPIVMYTELQFPPNQSTLHPYANKKESNASNILHHKLSAERNRFEQSIMRSKPERFKTPDGKNENDPLAISHLM